MSSTDDINSGGYRFASLTGEDNYKSWRLQMRASLFESDLTDFIDKPLSDIINAADKKEEPKLRKQDRRALGQIIMRCMPWILTFIETAPTARDAWETLRKRFQPSSTSAKIFI